MQAATVIPRLRSLVIGGTRFRTLALTQAFTLWAIVATGATVRLTASGLGCEHWPGCQPGHPFPEKDYHSYIEFSNRLVATVTIAVTLITLVSAVATRGLPRWTVWVVAATFVGTVAQAPLGAITVYADLNPLLVLSHLLLSMIVLAAGVVVAVEAIRLEQGEISPYVPPAIKRLGVIVAAACLALVVSGTLVTAAGPHPGGTSIRRLWSFRPAVEVHVRVTAVFGLLFLALLAYTWRNRGRWPGLFRAGLLVLGFVVVQMIVGETQYRTRLPWWLVLGHVALAAAVWAAVVAFATLLWRPIAAVAPARAGVD